VFVRLVLILHLGDSKVRECSLIAKLLMLMERLLLHHDMLVLLSLSLGDGIIHHELMLLLVLIHL
jgi:hypothetical protein